MVPGPPGDGDDELATRLQRADVAGEDAVRDLTPFGLADDRPVDPRRQRVGQGHAVGAALADELRPATPAGTLSLARAVRPAKGHDDVYIVKLRNAGAASYKGGVAGYPATKPAAGEKLDASASAVVSYVQHLEREHDAPTRKGAACGGERRVHLGRVMTVVVDQRETSAAVRSDVSAASHTVTPSTLPPFHSPLQTMP